MRSSLEMRRKVGAGISKAKSAAEASLIAAGMKRCRGVEHKGEPRPLAEFPAGRSLAGKSTWCRGCTNAYMRKGSPGYRPETEADKFVARAWRKTPAGQALQSRCGFRRRARALGLEDSGLSRDEWLLVCNKFEWKCFRCSSPCAKSGQRAIDHHVPLTLWRPMSVANAVLLCTSCNSSKNNKHPRDFYTPEQVAALSALGVETL